MAGVRRRIAKHVALLKCARVSLGSRKINFHANNRGQSGTRGQTNDLNDPGKYVANLINLIRFLPIYLSNFHVVTFDTSTIL